MKIQILKKEVIKGKDAIFIINKNNKYFKIYIPNAREFYFLQIEKIFTTKDIINKEFWNADDWDEVIGFFNKKNIKHYLISILTNNKWIEKYHGYGKTITKTEVLQKLIK